ncbi:probable glutamate receptor [Bacillus rossius redtenbacheri]|uniref:probable glutamate receptor n=1 Tax=Bacillus rossius redtenbacheri TaxID=93214 RepID=UPI002FDD7CD3
MRLPTVATDISPVDSLNGEPCQTAMVHQFAKTDKVSVIYLDINRGADLVEFHLRSSSMITALLALSENQAREVLSRAVKEPRTTHTPAQNRIEGNTVEPWPRGLPGAAVGSSVFVVLVRPGPHQVLDSGRRRWIQLLVMSADPGGFLGGLHVPMDSQLVFLQLRGRDLEVREAYRVRRSGQLIVRELGLASAEDPRSGFWERRSDLEGITLKAVANNVSLYINFEAQHPQKMESFDYDLWKLLEKTLNFKTEISAMMDGGAGMMADNGSWTGVIGVLQRSEADVAIADITVTTGRSAVADFTYVYWKNSLNAYVKWPTMSYVSDMRSFAAVMLATVFGATLAHFAATWLLSERGATKFPALFEVFSAFCQQGVTEALWPSHCSGCAVFVVTQLAGFLVCSIYSATLMSRLAVQTRTHSYEELVQLVNSSSYSVGYLQGDFSIEITKPLLEKWNVRDYKLDHDYWRAMERVCRGDLIFIAEEMSFSKSYREHMSDLCTAELVSVNVGSSPVSYAFRKNLAYVGAFNRQLLKMFEMGEINRLKKKWHRKEKTLQPEPERITMKHVAHCIASLFLGIAFSLLCLLAELLLAGTNG